jgi:hypothetical protein
MYCGCQNEHSAFKIQPSKALKKFRELEILTSLWNLKFSQQSKFIPVFYNDM